MSKIIMKHERIPDYDIQDPVKIAIGNKIRELVALDKADGGTRLLEFFFTSGLSEEEIKEIQYQPEILARPSQHIPLGWKDHRIFMFLAGRGLTYKPLLSEMVG